MYKVVFGLSETKIADRVLTNIINVLEDFKNEDIEIELVIYAEAIKCFAMGSDVDIEKVSEIIFKGVTIAACNNSLKQNDLGPENFDFNIKVVPAGIGELIRKQKEGWIYIKP